MNLQTLLFLIASNLILIGAYYFIFTIKDKQVLLILTVFASAILGLILNKISVFNYKIFAFYFIIPSLSIALLIHLIKRISKGGDKPTSSYAFIYKLSNGKELILNNPFRGIGVFGGAGSGKTKSFAKPTIANCARLNFTGFFYSYKKFDLTRCVLTQYLKHNSSVKLRYINFFDLDRTERVNPIHPDILLSPTQALQAAAVLMKNLIDNNEKSNDTFFGPVAESGLAGIIWRLKEDFPEYCSLPYVVAIATNLIGIAICKFIFQNKQASLIAAPFLQSAESEKQLVGLIASLSNGMRKLAVPEIFYVLNGNDFGLNVNDPSNPTLLNISNDQSQELVYSPIIALIIDTTLRLMNQENKLPSIAGLDEATTIKIPNFDNIPATGRENKIVTLFMCQDMVQAEGAYGRIGRDKILANLASQLFGLVRDPLTADRYSKMFGKIEKEHISKSVSSGTHGSSSKTISSREVDRYPPQVFQQLKSGEFYGIFSDSNMSDFHGQFELFDEQELDIPFMQTVTKQDVINNFNFILETANSIINQ